MAVPPLLCSDDLRCGCRLARLGRAGDRHVGRRWPAAEAAGTTGVCGATVGRGSDPGSSASSARRSCRWCPGRAVVVGASVVDVDAVVDERRRRGRVDFCEVGGDLVVLLGGALAAAAHGDDADDQHHGRRRGGHTDPHALLGAATGALAAPARATVTPPAAALAARSGTTAPSASSSASGRPRRPRRRPPRPRLGLGITVDRSLVLGQVRAGHASPATATASTVDLSIVLDQLGSRRSASSRRSLGVSVDHRFVLDQLGLGLGFGQLGLGVGSASASGSASSAAASGSSSASSASVSATSGSWSSSPAMKAPNTALSSIGVAVVVDQVVGVDRLVVLEGAGHRLGDLERTLRLGGQGLTGDVVVEQHRGGRRVGGEVTRVPHSPQNMAPGTSGSEQDGHGSASAASSAAPSSIVVDSEHPSRRTRRTRRTPSTSIRVEGGDIGVGRRPRRRGAAGSPRAAMPRPSRPLRFPERPRENSVRGASPPAFVPSAMTFPSLIGVIDDDRARGLVHILSAGG